MEVSLQAMIGDQWFSSNLLGPGQVSKASVKKSQHYLLQVTQNTQEQNQKLWFSVLQSSAMNFLSIIIH